jgi:hypothetical protein
MGWCWPATVVKRRGRVREFTGSESKKRTDSTDRLDGWKETGSTWEPSTEMGIVNIGEGRRD